MATSPASLKVRMPIVVTAIQAILAIKAQVQAAAAAAPNSSPLQPMLMYCYSAYGLNIRSVLPLPELASGEGGADVVIKFGATPKPAGADTDTERCLPLSDTEFQFFWPDVGSFLVRQGREIIVDPLPNVPDQVV